MIIPLQNGWRDETSEGPIYFLHSKGDWEVSQTRWNSPVWATNERRNLEIEFKTVAEAKKFVDDFMTPPNRKDYSP